jgi:hypothetical protein
MWYKAYKEYTMLFMKWIVKKINVVGMSQYIKLFNNKRRRYVIKKPYISIGRDVFNAWQGWAPIRLHFKCSNEKDKFQYNAVYVNV